jgi:hypothetical protein
MCNAALRRAPNSLVLLIVRSSANSTSLPPRLDLAMADADVAIRLSSNWWGMDAEGIIHLQMDDLQSAEEALTNAADFAQGLGRHIAQRCSLMS